MPSVWYLQNTILEAGKVQLNKMPNFFSFLSLCTYIALIVSCRSDPSPTEEFLHEAVLDAMGNVKLYWKFNDTYITFEVSFF